MTRTLAMRAPSTSATRVNGAAAHLTLIAALAAAMAIGTPTPADAGPAGPAAAPHEVVALTELALLASPEELDRRDTRAQRQSRTPTVREGRTRSRSAGAGRSGRTGR